RGSMCTSTAPSPTTWLSFTKTAVTVPVTLAATGLTWPSICASSVVSRPAARYQSAPPTTRTRRTPPMRREARPFRREGRPPPGASAAGSAMSATSQELGDGLLGQAERAGQHGLRHVVVEHAGHIRVAGGGQRVL